MKLIRSQQKIITRDAQILRHMRISKKVSLNQAGRLVRISGSAIAHIEQGRMTESGKQEAFVFDSRRTSKLVDLQLMQSDHLVKSEKLWLKTHFAKFFIILP